MRSSIIRIIFRFDCPRVCVCLFLLCALSVSDSMCLVVDSVPCSSSSYTVQCVHRFIQKYKTSIICTSIVDGISREKKTKITAECFTHLNFNLQRGTNFCECCVWDARWAWTFDSHETSQWYTPHVCETESIHKSNIPNCNGICYWVCIECARPMS